MKRLFAIVLISLCAVSLVAAQERRFTVDDLLKVRRVSDPQLSPKGDQIVYEYAETLGNLWMTELR